jgi:hypothetical protein
MTSSVRRWAAGVSLAGGVAVAAAMIGATEAPAARADVIDDLMMQSEGDLNDAATLYSGVDAALLPATQAADIGKEVTALQGEAGLVSQIQAQQDALSEALQTNSQLVGADNQLATASGDLLSAMNALVNDVDAGDYVTGFPTTLSSYLDRLDFAYAEAFQFLPAVLNSEFTTVFVGFPNVEPISPPTDIATGADSAATLASAVSGTSAADLLSDATTNYTDANQVLAEFPASSLGEYAPALASATEFDDNMLQGIANLGSAETALSGYGNGVLSEFLTPVFTNIDQSWDQASEAALAADQAAEGVIGTGSTADIAAALLAISGPEYEALEPAIQAEFIDLGAHFLTGGDFTSFGDLGAAVDPVSAIDPSMFTDLLSSIGL